jgi:hypothetical protein
MAPRPGNSWTERRTVVLAALVLSLQGCASVPLSTMVRMGSFSERDFSGLSADEVGVKIRIPRGFGLDVANSWLGIEVTSKAGIHDARFELDQANSQVVELPGGFFSGPKPGTEYELHLSNSSAGAFRDLQEFVSQGKAQDINIRVVPKLSYSPEGATSIVVWIDLRLSEREGYFPLVDGTSIPLERGAVRADGESQPDRTRGAACTVHWDQPITRRAHPTPVRAIFRRRNAICVCSGSSFGHTSWQPSKVMQPNTPSSVPTSS